MPRYRVEIVERHDQVLEEIWRAYQDAYLTRIIEVDAEDEDEARDLAYDGEGDLIEEDWSYGDVYDSEYYESGDLVESEYVESEIEDICEISEYEIREAEARRHAAEVAARVRAQWSSQWQVPQHSFSFKGRAVVPTLANPEWEV